MNNAKNELIGLCVKGLVAKKINNDIHKDRLMAEIKEINNQSEHEYFLDLYKNKIKYPLNSNNLLVPYLLDIVESFDIEAPPESIQGEFPDIDVDYLKEIQGYIKNIWAPKEFGKENVCNIGNYSTFGIKQSLIDMARVHGMPPQEIHALTTKLNLKDSEGKDLTWEKAVEENVELQSFCKENPEISSAAERLLNRNRGSGTHAAGLIISSKPLDELVPLIRGKDGVPTSAFVEGLHETDLAPLGLIKFDVLVLNDLQRIAECCRLVREHRDIAQISALDGQDAWTDLSYLNDSLAIQAAKEGKLKGVFQFDSDVVRGFAKEGGVDSFNDLVAYTSLNRPGPIKSQMHTSYIKRKRRVEEYSIPEILKPVLSDTYNVMCYQEQIMKVLNVVGDIPLVQCEKARKAISKKKEKVFASYKEMFVQNGQKKLNQSEDELIELWNQISSFASYGFNKSHAVAYTYISSRLLYLKVHFPLEFFAGTLKCSGGDKRIKDVRLEARKFDVKINSIDINKSGWNFEIVDDEIYIGFSNVKGIGEDIAQEIVDKQPYCSFEDFLCRFGTKANVIKPLLALGAFEGNPLILWEFYEYYKKETSKRESRDKINKTSKNNTEDEFRYILPEGFKDNTKEILEEAIIQLEDRKKDSIPKLVEFFKDKDINIDVEEAYKPIKKYHRNTIGYADKLDTDFEIKLSSFRATGDIKDEKMKTTLSSIPQVGEKLYYGFEWDHVLEFSEDYDGGRTLSNFDDETKFVLCIEAQVIQPPKQIVSKKGTTYYRVNIEDSSGEEATVIVWEEDYERFKEEFEFWEGDVKKGNLVKIRLQRPDPGFPTYKFESPPRHMRARQIPKDKEMDHRLIVMKRPEIFNQDNSINYSNDKILII